MEITDEEVDEEDEEEMEKTMSNPEWIERRKECLKILEDFLKIKDCDRLEILKRLIDVHYLLIESVTGWDNWINSPHVISVLPEKELKELFTSYIKITEEYLELDIKTTGFIEGHRDKTGEHVCNHKEQKQPQYSV